MIRYMRGNLLDANTEAMVNAVNTVGVMGGGIALTFKQTFPENFRRYAAACRESRVKVGRIFVTECDGSTFPKWIVNFPTKQHWRQPARMEWVIEGLEDLRHFIQAKRIRSIAIPALGCGLGGLDWAEVRMRIEEALNDLDDVDIFVFEPLT